MSMLMFFQRYLTTNSYLFYEVANFVRFCTICLNPVTGRFRGGVRCRSFVQIHTNCATHKIHTIWQKSYEFVRISHLVKYVRIAVRSGCVFHSQHTCNL